MDKKKFPHPSPEIPSPGISPELPAVADPEEPLLPPENPEELPVEEPEETPPYEVPPPGEGP